MAQQHPTMPRYNKRNGTAIHTTNVDGDEQPPSNSRCISMYVKRNTHIETIRWGGGGERMNFMSAMRMCWLIGMKVLWAAEKYDIVLHK